MKLYLDSVYEYLSDKLSKQNSDEFVVDDTSKEILKSLKSLVSKHEIFRCIIKLEKDIRQNQITNDAVACEFINKRLKKIKDKCKFDECKNAYIELKKMVEEKEIPVITSSNSLIAAIETAVDEIIRDNDDSVELHKCFDQIVKFLKSGKEESQEDKLELDEEDMMEIKERFEKLTNSDMATIYESYIKKDYEKMSNEYKNILNETVMVLQRVLMEQELEKEERKTLNESFKMLSKRKFNKNSFIEDIETLLSIKQQIEETYVNN
jgi:triphosphoribosyl-dephospho-CoA synthetase